MRGFFIGLSVSIAFIAGCVASQALIPPLRAGQSDVPRWEYLRLERAAGLPNALVSEAGEEGWELVSVDSSNVTAWFKRPLP